jgi:hypothetical protein
VALELDLSLYYRVQASDPRKSPVRIPFKEFVRKDPSEVSFCVFFFFFLEGEGRSERFSW